MILIGALLALIGDDANAMGGEGLAQSLLEVALGFLVVTPVAIYCLRSIVARRCRRLLAPVLSAAYGITFVLFFVSLSAGGAAFFGLLIFFPSAWALCLAVAVCYIAFFKPQP